MLGNRTMIAIIDFFLKSGESLFDYDAVLFNFNYSFFSAIEKLEKVSEVSMKKLLGFRKSFLLKIEIVIRKHLMGFFFVKKSG